MANDAPKSNNTSVRFGIVLRFSLIVSVCVLATALLVYLGMEYRLAGLYRLERQNRMRFLINTVAHGTRNLIASPGAHGAIPGVVEETLARAFRQGEPIVSCRITTRDNLELYRFTDTSYPKRVPRTCVSRPVLSGGEKLGAVELCFAKRTIFEAERIQQILTIGNTLSIIIRAYLLENDYFQIGDIVTRLTEEDPNILYCAVFGANGEMLYSRDFEKYAKEIPAAGRAGAAEVSAKRPVRLQQAGRRGEIVDASHIIEHRGEKLGMVRIGYSLASLRATMASKRRAMGGLILGLTLAALALSVLAARSIARPVRNLGAAVRTAAEHTPGREIDFAAADAEMEGIIKRYNEAAAQIKVRSDELGGLANSFGALLETLRMRFRELARFFRKMNQADRLSALGQLAAGIAHEINNPLTIISTYVQMMNRRQGLDDEFREELTIISEEIQRIAGKVKELLSFAQEKPPRVVSVFLHDFLRDAARLVRHALQKNKIALEENFSAPAGAQVSIDNSQMRQVFLNLFFNAMHAMKGGGTLTVGTRGVAGDNAIEITVADTGAGILPEHLPHIFDPFFTTKSSEEGTGLGLAVAYRIVQAHGGEIHARSAPGEGTVFSIILPPAPEEEPPEAA